MIDEFTADHYLKMLVSQANDDAEKAQAAEDKIAAIGTVKYTPESKGKIDAARNAYNNLTEAQKKLVSNYSVLTAAEARYKELGKGSASKVDIAKAAKNASRPWLLPMAGKL